MATGDVTGLGKYTARLRTVARRAEQVGEEVARESAEYGAERMRYFIATRGTGYVGRGARATPEGRIDTGQMIDAVYAGAPRKIQNGYSVSFGWIKGWQAYYSKQEEGFQAVPPMHALLDATVLTREYFSKRLREAVKEIA